MNKVTIVDAPCGYGKTSMAIQMMEENIFDRFVYITPFLPEVERVVNSVTNRVFVTPDVKQGKGSKRKHFYELIKEGNDIVSTHSLFRGVNKEVKDTIKEMEYILILDEVMDVVEQLKISTDDINMLLGQGVITTDEDNKVHWNNECYNGEFIKFYEPIKNGDVYLHNNAMILWTFPADVFNSFKEVYILTYMFNGQLQRYYYDMHNIDYEYKSVKRVGERGFGTLAKAKYELCDYEYIGGNKYKELINIYEGKLNDIGDDYYSLSSSWYKRANKKAPIKLLQKNTYNFFFNICKSKSKENMWTTFKDFIPQCKGKGYGKGFVECTARATNEYKDRTNCAYLINRFDIPVITQFFTARGVDVDIDTWALSELIQWLFRSGIREENEINLYIPSSRMRNLLKKWLD